MSQPEVAILVSTFERPKHLRRVLTAIASQQGVQGAMEVVVTDDGSCDETPRLVREFASSVCFPVHFTTHRHHGFHIARCRNEGVLATSAPYLLFLDGDCIIPPDHVRKHLERRMAGCAMAGYPIYFSESHSNSISEADIASAGYLRHVSYQQQLAMRWRHVRGLLGWLSGDPNRPKLLGGNLGIARCDYERVNGYDENYHGWGCEDDDIRLRLRAAGIQIASIAWWTHTYHLWHPKTPTAPATWREGDNITYFKRPARLTRCMAGMEKRRLEDLHVRFVGRPSKGTLNALPLWCRVAGGRKHSTVRPELELTFGNHDSCSPHADVRVFVAMNAEVPSQKLLNQSHLIFTPHTLSGVPVGRQFAIDEFAKVMQWQLGHSAALETTVARVA